MNTPAPVSAAQDVALGDVLLAMDVVDTLRHEQRIVSQALGAEAREQALIDRVRRAYAAQGIEVSDRLIAEGVARLKEQQFDYTPPPPGLKTSLAIAWVNRARIGTGLAAAAILAAIVGGGWYGFVELPKARAQAALVAMPASIERLRATALGAARTEGARQRVAREADVALAAAAIGDADAAERGAAALRETLALLQQELTVRIVSRPGVLSGVIRAPNDNPRASNYYLVVEAVDASGTPVRLPVTSEEDDSTRTVSMWGVRVDEATFDRVRRDKQDDGIIEDAVVGSKPRGHIDIDWAVPRAGGFIHSWDNRR